ncbi:short-chain dehydrogenase-like protein, partial [Leptotrombidium deliense]
PAYIKSEFLDTLGYSNEAVEALEEDVKNVYPLRRIGEAIDVAKAIAFLCSEDASYITGDCMVVDGGGSYVNITRR